MRFTVLLSILVSFTAVLQAQSRQPADALSRLQQKEMTGDVIITLEPLVLENYNKHLIQNSRNRGVTGFRIRIFSDNGMGARNQQMRVMADFLSLFPDIPVDPRYDGSYYKIYVGNFRTKRDALKILGNIKRNFPDAFIVEDNIVIEE
jgi:hypothetical protein